MQLQTLTTLLVGILSTALQAAATTATSYSSDCTDIAYDYYWLAANCTDDAGNVISSAVFLPNLIENSGGVLEWKADGSYEESCSSCELTESGSVLSCTCDNASNQAKATTLNLEEYIANYDGYLLSNLSGTPTVPSSSAALIVPSDLELVVILSTSDTCSTAVTWEIAGPETCKWLDITGSPIEFPSMIATTNEGWTFSAYNTSDCSGTPIATLDLDNVDTCVSSPDALYYQATPLWNWS